MADGTIGYTRNGQFNLDQDRNIVDANGFKVQWSGQIPENYEELRIDTNGTVNYRVGNEWTAAGVIQLARFTNPGGMASLGNNIWTPTAASGAAITGNPLSTNFGQIRSNALEMSNVDVAEEYTHMMTLQRIFTLSLRSFQQTDQMISQSINMRKA